MNYRPQLLGQRGTNALFVCPFAPQSGFNGLASFFAILSVYFNMNTTTPLQAPTRLYYCSPKQAKDVLSELLQSNTALLSDPICIRFPCSSDLIEHLNANAKTISSSQHYDEFFDGPDCTLTKKNWWLRFRDQKHTSMKIGADHALDEYLGKGLLSFREIHDEGQVLQLIRSVLPEPKPLKVRQPMTALHMAPYGYAEYPFIRHTYSTAYGTIYVDEMALSTKSDDFYVVGTIIITNAADIPRALDFLTTMGLDSVGPVRSKIAEWLFVRDNKTYQQLLQAGVILDVPYENVAHFTTPPVAKSLEWFTNYAEHFCEY